MTKSQLLQGCMLISLLQGAKSISRYLTSYVIAKIGEICHIPIDLCSTTGLRLLNIYLVCFVLPSTTKRIYRRIHPDASRDAVRLAALFPAFPLLSFFGNLYYTDVLSTTSVLYCYLLAMKNKYITSAMVLHNPSSTHN